MRVLHVISSLDGRDGGTSWACAGMASAQREYAGLKAEILTTYREGESGDVRDYLQQKREPVPVSAIGPANYPLRWHPQLSRSVEAAINRCDVVHVHGLWEDIQYQAARRAVNAGKIVVLTPHGMLDPWSLEQSKWKKKLYWMARWQGLFHSLTACHYITSSEKELANIAIPNRLSAIVEPLGIPTPLCISTGKGCADGVVRLLFLSRIHPKKNLEFIFRCLQKVNVRWELTIAGSGSADYEKQLVQLAKQLEIDDRVRFIGSVQGRQKWDVFGEADVFVLPSLQENFGIVVIEALSVEIPVIISTNVGLAQDLMGQRGVSVLPLVETEWVHCIENLRNLKATRPDKFTIQSKYSWEAIASAWKVHYERLANDRS
ncbi:MAG: glycosyltransferase [Planctomycetes bacterium]|nr:glycosyltransferase [Planctomycetota bacterium]